jgi:hypothetical protein
VKNDPAKQRRFLLRVEAALLDELRRVVRERVELGLMRRRKPKAKRKVEVS